MHRWQRRLFDPAAYRVVLFDQRGCGRSTPHASALDTDLTSNTTWNLIEDMESLRGHLGIERWQVLAGSWGSTLALAYAERFPDRVTEVILFGVTTGRHAEFDWLFRGGAAVFFPEQWERLRAAAPLTAADRDLVDAFHRMLYDPDPTVCGNGLHSSGACGSPRHLRGLRRRDCRRDSRTANSRWRSRAW